MGKRSKVTLSIKQADTASMDAATKAKIGSRPVIELSIKDGELVLPWSNPNAPVTVMIPYTPTKDELAHVEHITIWYIDNTGKLIPVPNAKYDAETGTVTFTTTHFSKFAVAYVLKTFADLSSYEWARNQIEVLASKGIIEGVSTDSYRPEAAITRADFMMVLVRMLGLSAQFTANFSDVNTSDYYYEAIGIAKNLGIATGLGDNRFNPLAAISRQDMMVLTVQALKAGKKTIAEGNLADLSAFTDNKQIAFYARENIASLVKLGLIVGSANQINAHGATTRAEIAVLLYRIYHM
jgi:hypothetical protein